ncbi:hypothetical protein PEBR_21171 [Penicillium brasilianum]|uniref:Uncharacterized protein n=1 Tax=Penicillium brasilianum TaxID=104259 RepID=A0A1S9RND7_PENBI|nr:hypothetical protein PEBR_21171 [Penicillium brasilianum]
MAAASSSSSDSSSSRSTSPEPENTQKKAVKAATKTKDEVEDESSESTDSSDSSDSDSSSDSGSESESESGSSSEMDTSEDATEARSAAKKVHIPGPNQPYKPPFGFKSAKKQNPPSSSTSSVLSNLRGKQVFHITAPSFLPLSKVKEITMSKVLKGEPILAYDGKSYGIPADSINDNDPEGKTLLVYDESTETYCNKSDHIQSFHVQELIGLPEKAAKSAAATIEKLRDFVKPPRPQPKGMKMRFRPVGSLPSEPETLGVSSESESEEPQIKAPARSKRKHPHTEGDATQASAEPRKKSKKHTQENADDEERSQKKSKKSHKDREEKKRKKSEKA